MKIHNIVKNILLGKEYINGKTDVVFNRKDFIQTDNGTW